MSTRKDFLKNSLMAIAVSLLPKILQPVQPELPAPQIIEATIILSSCTIDDIPKNIYLSFLSVKELAL